MHGVELGLRVFYCARCTCILCFSRTIFLCPIPCLAPSPMLHGVPFTGGIEYVDKQCGFTQTIGRLRVFSRNPMSASLQPTNSLEFKSALGFQLLPDPGCVEICPSLDLLKAPGDYLFWGNNCPSNVINRWSRGR